MYKLFISIFIVVFFNACGVDTSSGPNAASAYDDNTTTTTGDDWYGDGYIIDPNPIDGTSDDDNTSDDTSDDNNTSDGDNTSDDDGFSQEDSYFDISDAEYDEFACIIGDSNDGYTDKVIADDSVDDRATEDVEYGVLINSLYPQAYVGGTEVSLFYYSLTNNLVGTSVSITHDALYRISVDKGWADNEEKKVYVMTPANMDGLYSCYRYDLSTIDDNTYQRTKVYREK